MTDYTIQSQPRVARNLATCLILGGLLGYVVYFKPTFSLWWMPLISVLSLSWTPFLLTRLNPIDSQEKYYAMCILMYIVGYDVVRRTSELFNYGC